MSIQTCGEPVPPTHCFNCGGELKGETCPHEHCASCRETEGCCATCLECGLFFDAEELNGGVCTFCLEAFRQARARRAYR